MPFETPFTKFERGIVSNSKAINVCFGLIVQRLMVKTAQKLAHPCSVVFSEVIFCRLLPWNIQTQCF